ncbi:hypothetical protein IQ230_25445 [Gloeocapsopsis crepidinum LEGE 06123]|uniref:Bacteriocin n=1 Tax=Gloeocapsopsis crepidinum LEGE 06123 TaxID=588587 RepID=A0ABR9UZ55_9CHRO|nr:hypothetical protein [Gloeocapsopsis crepidinum]MBE9193604.1 hypothetical protein [Gloeocapsopsis crepidinum LEGE 06123]
MKNEKSLFIELTDEQATSINGGESWAEYYAEQATWWSDWGWTDWGTWYADAAADAAYYGY